MTSPRHHRPPPTPRRPEGSFRLGAAAAGILLVCAACGPPPLASTQATSEDLARAVLQAFERRDAATLRTLALTEQEFREHIWPELPAARPARNVPFSYVWGDLRQKSEEFMAASLARHGGRRFELRRVEHDGEISRHETFVVRRDTVLVVRDDAGVEQRLRLYGSTLEKGGAFKVFSYVTDD